MTAKIHPAIAEGNVAVITGGASGIGLAAAKALATQGMKVAIVDLGEDRLATAAKAIATVAPDGKSAVLTVECDVATEAEVTKMAANVLDMFEKVHVLMNNAGIGIGSTFTGPLTNWQRVIAVNMWGVVHSTHAFLPAMLDHGASALIINTGSKQGITTPPGDTAYNMSKAGVKVFTEALQHDLRNRDGCNISAHLLIPGFVFTGMTAGGRSEKPDAAWTPEQTVSFMLDSIQHGDFYILCPDNDVPRALDEKRIAWAAGDIIENRPPLSRWHPRYADAFKAYLSRKQDL